MPSRLSPRRSRPLALFLLALLLAVGKMAERGGADGAATANGDVAPDGTVTLAALPAGSDPGAVIAAADGPPGTLVPISAAEPRPSDAPEPEPEPGPGVADEPPRDAPAAPLTRPARESEALGSALEGLPYPHPVQFLTLRLGAEAVRLAYMDVAPAPGAAGATGRAALLLHGAELAGDSWEPTIAALTGAGWRVIVPDLVGHGKSGKPGAALGLDAHADHAALLLDSLAAPDVVVVGHALGAAVAARLAQRAAPRVRALVLAAPVGLDRRPLPQARLDSAYEAELARVDPAEIRGELARAFATWEPAYEGLVRVRTRVAAGGDYPRWARGRAGALRAEAEGTVAGALRALDVPALVVAGEEDRVAPSRCGLPSGGAYRDSLRAAVGRSAHGALVTLPGVGHVPQLEAAVAFHTLLFEFVEE